MTRDPQDIASDREQYNRIMAMLLPDERVLVSGASDTDIAAQLGLTVNNVRVKRKRLLDSLRKALWQAA
ncbi:MAG TPA: hypothetical protein VHV55_14630 [Pirellulales bacterium]|jgi:DNA-binding NarL/FixJ family response regulator|nr:hypothetical protein [Pirellulales bacterium]